MTVKRQTDTGLSVALSSGSISQSGVSRRSIPASWGCGPATHGRLHEEVDLSFQFVLGDIEIECRLHQGEHILDVVRPDRDSFEQEYVLRTHEFDRQSADVQVAITATPNSV